MLKIYKKVNRGDLLNLWLKYHNTTFEQVINSHIKEVLESPYWFKLYPCTQEQLETWTEEAKELLIKKNRFSRKFIDRVWWIIYLDCSPHVESNNL